MSGAYFIINTGISSKSLTEDREYYQEYLEKCKSLGADVFIIEYTTDKEIVKTVKEYCNEKDYSYYISDTIELD